MDASNGCKFPDWVGQFIRDKARHLAWRHRQQRHDQEDIEQDLWERLLKRIDKFDPSLGRYKDFVILRVNDGVVSFLEKLYAQKRDYHCEGPSLNQMLSAKNGTRTERSDLTPENACHRLCRHAAVHAERQRDLVTDVRDLLGQLSPADRELCELLSKYSRAETARKSGLPRSTLYERINRLRQVFEDAGLAEYF